MRTTGTWHKVQLTQLRFPAECASCEAPTDRVQEFSSGRGVWVQVLERIVGWEEFVMVPVPLCETCASTRRRRRIKGVAMGTALGLLGCVVLAVVLASVLPFGNQLRSMVPAIIFLAGPVLGFVLGGSPPPVGLRNYRSGAGSVDVRFSNAAFEARVLGDLDARVVDEIT